MCFYYHFFQEFKELEITDKLADNENISLGETTEDEKTDSEKEDGEKSDSDKSESEPIADFEYEATNNEPKNKVIFNFDILSFAKCFTYLKNIYLLLE